MTPWCENYHAAWDWLSKARRLNRMKAGVFAASELLDETFGRRSGLWMVTLTYAPGSTHRRKHVSEYTEGLRKWAKRKGIACGYVWVLELTKKAVPHYHVVVWLGSRARLPKGDLRRWWPHGMTQTVKARNPVGYLMKYATKGTEGKPIPRGARLFGCGGLSLAARRLKSWRLLPGYVRAIFNFEDRVQRVSGGGWVALASGEFLESVRLVYYDHYIRAMSRQELEDGLNGT